MILRIKEVSKEKGVTLISPAEMAGAVQPTMNNLANGKTTPSLEAFEKIATALHVPISELFEQPKIDSTQITCTNCGKSITIKAEQL